jgi:VWFA-related protein
LSPALVALLSLAAQTPPTFAASVEAVYVDVFVTDAGGPVTGLTAADFELHDEGQRREFELVGVESLPLTTYLVLDASGSVAGEKLARLQEGVRALLRGLRPGDKAALVTFAEEIAVRVRPTDDAPRLQRAIHGILPSGSTALYDSLYAGTLLASGRGRSLVVLFTDGEDNLSWLDAAQVQRVLEESNVLLQVVGVLPPEGPAPTPRYMRPATPEPAHVRVLRRLAETTGGRFWAAAAPRDLARAFAGILDAMRTRYVLRFEPDGARRVGLHPISVRLTRRKGHVQCRRAYFVGPLSP